MGLESVETTRGGGRDVSYTVIPNYDLNAGFTALLKIALNGIRNDGARKAGSP